MREWIEDAADQDAIKKATDQALTELQCIRREAAQRSRSDAEYIMGHLSRAASILDHIRLIVEREVPSGRVD